jgi:hypothetical protein
MLPSRPPVTDRSGAKSLPLPKLLERAVSLQSVKFDHMVRFCAPSVVHAAIHHAAHKQRIKPSEWLRGAVSEALSRDGFGATARSEEFALVADGGFVDPNFPPHLKPYCGTTITTFWPSPVEGCVWLPVETEGVPNGTMPRYRVDGERVIRSYGEAA